MHYYIGHATLAALRPMLRVLYNSVVVGKFINILVHYPSFNAINSPRYFEKMADFEIKPK
jgi:hypothetical protein